MTHDELVGQVQTRAKLASRGDAERAIRATLEALATRLDGDNADHLAAQLPNEIGVHLRGDAPFERLSLDEFFGRVKEWEGAGVDLPDAVYHARVVMEVLGEAVSPGAIEKIRKVLPDEFAPLFAGSRGKMNRGPEAAELERNAPGH